MERAGRPAAGTGAPAYPPPDAAQILDQMHDSMIATDPEGWITLWSRGAQRLFGYRAREVLGHHISMLYAPEQRPFLQDQVIAPLKAKGTHETEALLRSKSGQEVPIHLSLSLLRDEQGVPVGMIGFSMDLTAQKRAERALAESEQRFRQLAEHVRDVFWLTEAGSGRVLYVSPAYETIWGRSVDSLYADPHEWLETIHPDDRGRVERLYVEQAARGGFDVEYRLRRPGGELRWIHDRGFPVRDGRGQVCRLAGVAEDITDRKLAEEALRESEERYRRLVELDPHAIFLVDSERIVFANAAGAGLLGAASPQALLDRPILDFVAPRFRRLMDRGVQRVLESGSPSPLAELTLRRADGSTVDVEATAHVFGESSRPALQVIVRDITERRRADREHRARIRQQAIAHLGRRALAVADLQPLMDETVALVARVLDADLVKVLELLPGDGRLLLRAGIGWNEGSVGSATVEADTRSQAGYTMARMSGDAVIVDNLATDRRFDGPPLLLEHGVTSGISVVIRGEQDPFGVLGAHTRRHRRFSEADGFFLQSVAHVLGTAIERQRSLEALRESEQRFQAIFDQTSLFIGIMTPGGTLIDVNRAPLAASGFRREDVLGLPLWETGWWNHAPEAQRALRAHLAEAARGRRRHEESAYFTAEGAQRFADWTFTPIKDARERVVLVIAEGSDVTVRKEAEESLRASEEEFRAMFERAGAGKAQLDPATGRFLRVNRKLCDITGYAAEELTQMTVADLAAPRYRDGDAAGYQALLRGERREHLAECQYARKDGSSIWVHVNATLIHDADGRPLRTVAVFEDITERKRAEKELARHRDDLEVLVAARTADLQATHARLRVVDRMASIGTMAAGIGHDMNNLLLPIRCHLNALEATPVPRRARESLGEVRRCMTYLQQLADGLHQLALDPDAEMAGGIADMPAWWSEMSQLLTRAVPHGTVIRASFADDLPPVSISPHRLTQAVLNLVVNAGEAVGEDGNVVIRAEPSADRRAVRLTVTDDGGGMTPEARLHAMDPFYTTKTRRLGTGLGLTLVHSIVDSVGGAIDIDSAPGRGTTVTLTLPATRGSTDASTDRLVAAVSIGDRRAAALVSMILEEAGFEVQHPGSGIPDRVALWVAEPTEDVLAAARSGIARRLVLFGSPPAGATPQDALVIERPHDFQAIRRAVGSAVTAVLKRKDHEAQTDSSPLRR
jgi:PAS domain S-box-containing protein